MSKALSLDLRERVLLAVADGGTHREVASRFGVSAASVSRWRALEREHGDARPGPLGGDRRSGRVEAQAETILGLVRTTPDLTIEELRRALMERGLQFGFGTLQCFLIRHNMTRKKKTGHASEQDRPDVLKRRRAWFEAQPDLDPSRLVFIDETWAKTNMTRSHGRAPKGERLRMGAPHGHSLPGSGLQANRERGNTTTFIGALTLRGMPYGECVHSPTGQWIAPFVISGPINRASFEVYVEKDVERHAKLTLLAGL